MGFIEIAAVNYSDELNGIWNNYIDLSKRKTADIISEFPEKISDGMRFFIGQDQSLIMFSDDKISDYITGPGAFVFHKAFEPGEYTDKSRERFNAVLSKYPESFAEFSENTKCLIVNDPDKVLIQFDFSEAVYFDKAYMFNVTMQGNGYFEVGMSDALTYFAETGLENVKFEQVNFGEMTEEDKNKLAANFADMLRSALSDMKEFDIDYDKLIYNTDVIVNCINSNPQNRQYLKPGAEIRSLEFSSIFPDEKSIIEIVKFRRENGIS